MNRICILTNQQTKCTEECRACVKEIYSELKRKHLKNKFKYLIKTFPFIEPQQYVFTTNKEIINCDIKIDDRAANLKGKAEKKLLFSAYHNKNIPDEELKKDGLIRVNNWKEVEKILL